MNEKEENIRLKSNVKTLSFTIYFLIIVIALLLVLVMLQNHNNKLLNTESYALCEVNNRLITMVNWENSLLEEAYNVSEGNLTRLEYLESCSE